MVVRRERVVLGQESRHCSICKADTVHELGKSAPMRRRLRDLRRRDRDMIDLVERPWTHCLTCGFRFSDS